MNAFVVTTEIFKFPYRTQALFNHSTSSNRSSFEKCSHFAYNHMLWMMSLFRVCKILDKWERGRENRDGRSEVDGARLFMVTMISLKGAGLDSMNTTSQQTIYLYASASAPVIKHTHTHHTTPVYTQQWPITAHAAAAAATIAANHLLHTSYQWQCLNYSALRRKSGRAQQCNVDAPL